MANVLVYAPFAIWSPHYETDLELAKIAAIKGHQVSFLLCDGSLPSCAPNADHAYFRCQMCKTRSLDGIKWLQKTFDIKILPSFNLTKEESTIINTMIEENYTSIQEIKNLEFEGCDIGMAALSSVISHIRDSSPSFNTHRDVIKKNIQTAMIVYFTLKKVLLANNYDQLILFNGRFSAVRPALRIARKMGVEVIVHERGSYVNEYSLTKNTYPHDINYIYQQLRTIKRDIPENIYNKLGSLWFEERIKGQQHNWKSFTESQTTGKVPKEVESDALKIAIYNSSEDEFEAIEEWKNPYYETQNKGIVQILNDSQHLKIQYFLRVHPNLKGINNTQTKELRKIKNQYKNLVFIDADSDISTYDLIQSVDLVIVFGSTVGIEAAYMGKPVCVMGKTPYDILDACISPKDHQHLIRLITDFSLGMAKPTVNNDSNIYGYWQKKKSIPFNYIKQTDISQASLLDGDQEKPLNTSIRYLTFSFLYKVSIKTKKCLRRFIKHAS